MWRLRAPLLALLLMQVILLASSGVTATKKPLGKQETCNMKNHMIEYLRNNGVQIYERPQISSAYCNTEWDVYGTCCESGNLTTHIHQKQQQNNQALFELTKELEDLKHEIETFKQKCIQESHSVSRVGNGVSFSTAEKTEPGQLDRLTKINKLQNWMNNMVKSNIKNQQKCVAKINSVISKSACSICSGRSDDFFNENGKLKISEPACRAVIDECLSAWSGMVNIAEGMKTLISKIRALNQFSESDGALEELGFTMNLDSFITNRNLIPILESCESKELRHCPFENVAVLCEELVHIQAPSYVESKAYQAIRLITNSETDLQSFNDASKVVSSLMASIGETSHNASVVSATGYAKHQVKLLSELTDATNILVSIWFAHKKRTPLIDRLIPRFTKGRQIKTDLEAMLSKIKTNCDRIVETVARAAAVKYRVLLHFFTSKMKNDKEAEKTASSMWDHFSNICAEIEQPTSEQSIFNSLSRRVGEATKEYKRNKLAMRQYFESSLHRKLAEYMKGQASRTSLQPGRSLSITNSKSMKITSELFVAKVQECNPCAPIEDDSMKSP